MSPTLNLTHSSAASSSIGRNLKQEFAFVSAPIDTPQHLPLFTRARSLGCNDLGPEGGAALVEGLKRNLTLQVLK